MHSESVPTEAERHYQVLRRTLMDFLTELSERTGVSIDEGLTRLGVSSEIREAFLPGGELTGDRDMFEVISEPVVSAMKHFDKPKRSMEKVTIGSLIGDEAVTAECRPMSDGSSLVTMSYGMFTLINNMAPVAVEGMDWVAEASNPLAMLWRVSKAMRGMDPFNAQLSGAYLRFRLTMQRVFGSANWVRYGSTLDKRPTAMTVAICAFHFTIAHEIAHHILGHAPGAHAISPNASRASQQMETEADTLALQAIRRVHFSPQDALGDIPLMGAIVGIHAIQAVEDSCFIRRGFTHPPTAWRIANLYSNSRAGAEAGARSVLSKFNEAMELATEFSPGCIRGDLNILSRSSRIKTILPASGIAYVKSLDDIMCATPDRLESYLVKATEIWPILDLESGVREALNGNTKGALQAWGVRDRAVLEICDPERNLTFRRVFSEVLTSLGGRTDRSTDRKQKDSIEFIATGAASLATWALRRQ
ncbi:hypothetical protein ACFYW6_18000 [Streptomyces sp. NPDC002659]|uniref:hypothetical protein n=1 Tax=Streptomyces sp. NPDC002659 TaxID=3364656 RepID=UPI0036B33BE0